MLLFLVQINFSKEREELSCLCIYFLSSQYSLHFSSRCLGVCIALQSLKHLPTKIIVQGNEAVSVEFVHDGKLHRVTASKEVILSSGVIQTPQLLELSSIKDPEALL